jgi:hypothetical protein
MWFILWRAYWSLLNRLLLQPYCSIRLNLYVQKLSLLSITVTAPIMWEYHLGMVKIGADMYRTVWEQHNSSPVIAHPVTEARQTCQTWRHRGTCLDQSSQELLEEIQHSRILLQPYVRVPDCEAYLRSIVICIVNLIAHKDLVCSQ